MRIFENANYAIIPKRKYAYLFSSVLVLLSLLSLLTRGVEMGIDFLGGMEFVVETRQDVSATDARAVLTDVLASDPEVKTYGTNQLLVRTATTESEAAEEVQAQIVEALQGRFPEAQPAVVKADVVGPRFADDLKDGALYATIGSLLVMFIYIMVRWSYDWRYSVGAVAALLHNVVITLGLFSLLYGIVPFSLSVDQSIIAALLTIIGYSINDTVVIFDRIRENHAMFKTERYDVLVNRALNSTLGRTVVTGTSVLMTLIVLFIFGGEVLRGFAFAMFVGIVIGTYSSVAVAAPMVVELKALAARRK